MNSSEMGILPLLIGATALMCMALAYCIELLRFHWLDWEELPDQEQVRLLAEAKQTVYKIGAFTGSPDPRVMRYYTKLHRRSK